jgi:PHD/YefM family antitoxin component YafN of YafNO toxin-antitoxin module
VRVKKAAERGPVFITRYGRVAYVLMTFEEYTKLAGAAEKAEKQIDKRAR